MKMYNEDEKMCDDVYIMSSEEIEMFGIDMEVYMDMEEALRNGEIVDYDTVLRNVIKNRQEWKQIMQEN